MGVRVSIYGAMDPEGKLSDMLDLAELCEQLETAYPPELVSYFKGTEVLDLAERRDRQKAATEIHLKYDAEIPGLLEGDPESGDGCRVNLHLLPDDIKHLRICME